MNEIVNNEQRRLRQMQKRERGKKHRGTKNTNFVLPTRTSNDNNNLNVQTSCKVGYILTKLGQSPFMLIIEITYPSLYKEIV